MRSRSQHAQQQQYDCYMEIIAEILLGFIVEVVIPVVGEIAFEVLLHSLGQPFV